MIASKRQNEFVPLPITVYLKQIIQQLEIQAGLNEHFQGAHPDPAIRNFNQGLLTYLTNGAHFDFLLALAEVYKQKLATKTTDPGHFVDLIARAVQYLERLSGRTNYAPYSSADWLDYFDQLSQADLAKLVQVLIEKQVSTHVLSRYRGLAAMSVMAQKRFDQALRIADIGCSLNLGLPLALQPTLILNQIQPNLKADNTPESLFTTLLNTPKVDYDHAVGVDLQPPDKDWVAACSYFSNYETYLADLNQAEKLLETLDQPIEVKAGDVTDVSLIELVKNPVGKLPHIIHASMCLYQVSIQNYLHALTTIANSLEENGIFVELTFKEPKNWFKTWNVQSLVRFKQPDGYLTPAAEWLVWKNSRCDEVMPGKDYELVNQKMNLL